MKSILVKLISIIIGIGIASLFRVSVKEKIVWFKAQKLKI